MELGPTCYFRHPWGSWQCAPREGADSSSVLIFDGDGVAWFNSHAMHSFPCTCWAYTSEGGPLGQVNPWDAGPQAGEEPLRPGQRL